MSASIARAWAVIVAVVLAVVTVVAGAIPAHAADRPPRSPAPPGTGYSWGVAPAQLPECSYPATFEDASGGWSGRRAISAWQGGVAPGREVNPELLTWGEPCYDASFAAGVRRVRVPVSVYSLAVASSPISLPSSAYVQRGPETIAGTSVWPQVTCASTEWSASQSSLTTSGGGGFEVTNASLIPGGGSVSAGKAKSWSVESSSSCAFLVSVRMIVCVYEKGLVGSGGFVDGIRKCSSYVWQAGRWYDRSERYSTEPLDVQLCRAGAYSADCVSIDPPDEWTWESACGYPPAYGTGPAQPPDWGADWWNLGISWVFTVWFPFIWNLSNELIGHYVTCTFVPPGGWDSRGDIPNAWASGGLVNTFSVIGDAATAFTITESCGVLVAAPTTVLGGFTVNTCDWGWAAPLKEFIRWTSWLLFAWWGVAFVVGLVMSVIKAAPMPNPLVADIAERQQLGL